MSSNLVGSANDINSLVSALVGCFAIGSVKSLGHYATS